MVAHHCYFSFWVLGKLKQEDGEFEAILGCAVRLLQENFFFKSSMKRNTKRAMEDLQRKDLKLSYSEPRNTGSKNQISSSSAMPGSGLGLSCISKLVGSVFFISVRGSKTMRCHSTNCRVAEDWPRSITAQPKQKEQRVSQMIQEDNYHPRTLHLMKNDHGRASGKTRPREAEKRGLCWRACSLELEHSLQIETFAPGKMSRLRAWGRGV